MLNIPNLSPADVAFGNVKHMPKYDAVPERFKTRHDPFVEAVSNWFFNGAKATANGIIVGDHSLSVKPGIDRAKALSAVRAVLGSFEPKHEHKTAACAYMLSEWFDLDGEKKSKTA